MDGFSWLLASVVSSFGAWSGWRLDILLVRVVRAGAVFVGLAVAVSPPVARLESADVRMDAREYIDTVGVPVDDGTERADVRTNEWVTA